MVKRDYIPDRGDVIWFDFDPTRGHEQRGYRPAVVISPKAYNVKTGLLLACPVTSHPKGYPFEVLCQISKVDGAILADHVRNMDWRDRRIKFISSISETVVDEVIRRLFTLVKL